MKFGQYELLEPIAVGGMAEVYKGRVVGAEGFEKHVAIKRILPELAEDERFVKMLLTEARIHSALSHRNIVQIHDLGISEDGEYFIVLEYVEGYDLRVINEQLAAAGEIIPEALSLHIASELALGLQFAHELKGADGQPLGLVHRDVTPSNVLISMAGEVKLSDFGLAKRRQDRSVVGSIKGNLAYMSPEQALAAPLDRRTDVFSLGAVLFEMLTGRRLRAITDEVAGWSQVASGVVPSARSVRPDLPEGFERLLERALAAEPARRFPDAAAFGSAIRELLAAMNTPVGPTDLQALLSVIRPPRRARALMDRSKVIRLGPEAQALKEAITAPPTPPPMPVPAPIGAPTIPLPPSPLSSSPLAPSRPAPGMTPGSPPRSGIAVVTPPEYDEAPATPLPVAPLQAIRSPTETMALGASPFAPAALAPRRATPPARAAVPQAQPPSARQTPRTPNATARPTPPRPTPAAPAARVTPPRPAAFVPAAAPPPEPSAPAMYAAGPGVVRAGGTMSLPSWPLPGSTTAQPTDRIHARTTGLWRPIVVGILAVLIVAAYAVHVAVIPLEVLASWTRPATLYVASEPDGAVVKVDGVALPDPAPTKTAIKRDRFDHVIEVSAPGYRPVREIVRYDREVVLSFVLRMQKQETAAILPNEDGAAAGSAAASR
jgi:serine/threonine protein kinase